MNKKLTGILCYFSILLWIIAYVAGDKEGAKFHLNQGLVLNLVGLVASAVAAAIPVLGALISVVMLVFLIMGVVAAAKDEEKPLPIIGGINILK